MGSSFEPSQFAICLLDWLDNRRHSAKRQQLPTAGGICHHRKVPDHKSPSAFVAVFVFENMQRSMMSRNGRLLDSSSSDEDNVPEDSKSNGSSGSDDEEDATPTIYRNVHNNAKAYLVGYETMVRQQEADDVATWSHLKPCITRLQELAGVVSNAKTTTTTLDTELSFEQLRKALHVLESTGSTSSSNKQGRIELLATDRQLMMILRVLTQKQSCDDDGDDMSLTIAEFVQCYQIAIVGMLTLQKLPNPSMARNRARDRTMSMLSLFEPPSTKIFNDFSTSWQDESSAKGYAEVRLLFPGRRKKWIVVLALVAVAGFLIHGSVGHGTILQTHPDVPTPKWQKSTLHSSLQSPHFRPTSSVSIVSRRPSPVTTTSTTTAHLNVQRRQSGVRSVVVGSFVAAAVGPLATDTVGWMMLAVPPIIQFSLMAGVGVVLSVLAVSMKGTVSELLEGASPWTFGEYRMQLEM